jgi:hypothetical protein
VRQLHNSVFRGAARFLLLRVSCLGNVLREADVCNGLKQLHYVLEDHDLEKKEPSAAGFHTILAARTRTAIIDYSFCTLSDKAGSHSYFNFRHNMHRNANN